MTNTPRILITGATGFIGRYLFERLKSDGFEVFTSSTSKLTNAFNHSIVDLRETEKLITFLDRVKPSLIFHTAAVSSIDGAENNRKETYSINVLATEVLANWAKINRSKLVYFSSDFVFDGTSKKALKEDAPTNPISYYGQTKLLGEKKVKQSQAQFVIIRPVMVYGNVFEGQRLNFPIWIRNNAGQKLNITDDQIRNPTHISDVIEASMKLGFGTFSGVYHISGSESISVFDFAKQVLDYYNIDSNKLNPIKTSELKTSGLRPLYSVLSFEKARNNFGYNPKSILEGIRTLNES